jgi:hypothetical protein
MTSFSIEHEPFSLPIHTNQTLPLRSVVHIQAAYRVRQRFPTPLCNFEASDRALERLDSKCIFTR